MNRICELNSKIMLNYSLIHMVKHLFNNELRDQIDLNPKLHDLKDHLDSLTTLAKHLEKLSSEIYLETF